MRNDSSVEISIAFILAFGVALFLIIFMAYFDESKETFKIQTKSENPSCVILVPPKNGMKFESVAMSSYGLTEERGTQDDVIVFSLDGIAYMYFLNEIETKPCD